MTQSECSKCGDCCEVVTFDIGAWKRKNPQWRRLLLCVDPRVDWEPWKAQGYADSAKADTIRNWLDANFILKNWFPIGDGEAICAAWDPETRLCTAHDDRPPVCRSYPWYSTGPRPDAIESARCSFWADVPVEQRPAWVTFSETRRSADV